MKAEILKPFLNYTCAGLLMVPAFVALTWLFDVALYFITLGNFMLYDHPPLDMLEWYLSSEGALTIGIFSAIVGGYYGLLGILASFRTYRLLAHYCRRNGLNFRDLSYMTKDQLADAYKSLSVLDDGNSVVARDEKFFFVDRIGSIGTCAGTEIPFRFYHGVRTGKYKATDIRKKFKHKKWKVWIAKEEGATG